MLLLLAAPAVSLAGLAHIERGVLMLKFDDGGELAQEFAEVLAPLGRLAKGTLAQALHALLEQAGLCALSAIGENFVQGPFDQVLYVAERRLPLFARNIVIVDIFITQVDQVAADRVPNTHADDPLPALAQGLH